MAWHPPAAIPAPIQQSQAMRRQVRIHHKKQAIVSVSSIHAGAYIFALCEKKSPYAEHAMNAAAINAVRRLNICRARKYITGVMSVPHNAGTQRSTAGVSVIPPATR